MNEKALTMSTQEEFDNSLRTIDAVIDNSVIGYDGNFVLIEDDEGKQYK